MFPSTPKTPEKPYPYLHLNTSLAPDTPSSERSQSPFRRSSDEKYHSPMLDRALKVNRGCRIKPFWVFLSVGFLLVFILPFAHPRSRAIVHDYVHEYLSSSYITTDLSQSHIPKPSGQIPDHLNIPLTLEARLSYLLSRPALHQWEAELPNRHKCPFYTYNRNTYFFHEGKPEQWEKVTPDDIRGYRKKIVEHLRDVERNGGKLVWEEGMDAHVPKHLRRGIIMAAGDGKRLERALLSIYMLRKVVHSKLPVEIYHFPDELQNPELKKEISEAYDVTFVQVDGKNDRTFEAWNVKNIAFLTTKFTEFVYIDSDNFPLADPAELFESVEYKQSGSVFWPDLNKDHPDNAIWRIMGRDCSDEHWPAEAGQLVFDKRANNGLNLAVLHLSNHMMNRDDLYGFLSYGDKDTFRYSFYALGLPYQMAPRFLSPAGGYQDDQGHDGDFCGHSMIQWGLTPPSEARNPKFHPKPAFIHTILAKHRQGLQHQKLFSHVKSPRLDAILEERLVRTYYEWNGRCFEVTLKGPEGVAGVENSMMDGQGVIMRELKDVIGNDEIMQGLQDVAERYVEISNAKEEH